MIKIEELAEQLIGLEFEGNFQRDQELVAAAAAHNESIKEKNPTAYAIRLESAAVEDKEYDFWMKIMEYDPNTGLFLARGKDEIGESGIVGKMATSDKEGGQVGFLKAYIGEFDPYCYSIMRLPLRRITYLGRIVIPDNVITIGGDYQPEWLSDNYRGTWRLDSKPFR